MSRGRRSDVTILFGSQKGASARLARQLSSLAAARGLSVNVSDLRDFEVENLWQERCVVLCISTYEGGTPPQGAAWFFK